MDSLLVELQSQIDLGDTLVENCRNILSHVSGISKFESRINAELKFLKPLLKKTSKLKEKGFQKRSFNHSNFRVKWQACIRLHQF